MPYKLIRNITVLFIIIILLLSSTTCAPASSIVRVIKVIDGDTITIEGGYRVRYIGIDTPETYPETEAYGLEALEVNRSLVEGKYVRLERDVSETDKYGRLLRYVYVGDIFVNAYLVRQGMARAVAYPPDTKHQDYLEQMEREAINADRGIWKK